MYVVNTISMGLSDFDSMETNYKLYKLISMQNNKDIIVFSK